MEFQIPNFKFYFTHFVNTFENDTGVVFDACTFNHNPFMDTGPAAIPNEFNRTLRNQFERVPVMRFVLHLQGSQQGQVATKSHTSTTPLFQNGCSFSAQKRNWRCGLYPSTLRSRCWVKDVYHTNTMTL